MRPRHHEHGVKHGQGAPHIRVVAVHIAKIIVQPEFTALIRVMAQNVGVVPFHCGVHHAAGGLRGQTEHGFKNVRVIGVPDWRQFAVFSVEPGDERRHLLGGGGCAQVRNKHGGKRAVERDGVVHEVALRNGGLRGGDSGKPPVNDAHIGASTVHHEVFGFQVVVYDTQLVHGHNRAHQQLGDVVVQAAQPVRIQRRLFHPPFQIRPQIGHVNRAQFIQIGVHVGRIYGRLRKKVAHVVEPCQIFRSECVGFAHACPHIEILVIIFNLCNILANLVVCSHFKLGTLCVSQFAHGAVVNVAGAVLAFESRVKHAPLGSRKHRFTALYCMWLGHIMLDNKTIY